MTVVIAASFGVFEGSRNADIRGRWHLRLCILPGFSHSTTEHELQTSLSLIAYRRPYKNHPYVVRGRLLRPNALVDVLKPF